MVEKVCVVGCGRWGRNHIRTLAEMGHLYGVVETDGKTRESVQNQYPRIQTYDCVDKALGQDFDGYVVATPAETHYEIASVLIKHKNHVLVEKPITLHVHEANDLVSMASAAKVNLMVGHVLLFHPAIRKIRDLIREGKIGRLEYIYSNRLNLGTVRTEENILWSFAPHDISIFQHFIGQKPEEVVSRGGIFLQPGIHDVTMTTLKYPGNIVGHIFLSWLHPFKEHRLVLIGSKGMLSFEDSTDDKKLVYYEKGFDWVCGEPVKRDGPTEVIDYDNTMPLAEELKYFVSHLDGHPMKIAHGGNGVEVLEILERATRSLLSSDDKSAPRTEKISVPARDYFVHPSSFVDDKVEIGKGTKIWHFSHIQSGARIGRNCIFGQNVNIANNVRIGDNVKIQNNVSVYEGVELEDYVFCGPSMVFTNVTDPRCKYPQKGSDHYRKTLVKYGTSIGANATILCGHTIGKHAFIGAGAVVTKDVPDYALMVGVPAMCCGWVCECGQRLPAPLDKVAICERCRMKYVETPDGLHSVTETGASDIDCQH